MVNASAAAAVATTPVTRGVVRFPTRDGLTLAIEQFGRAASPPVVFAHGFGQSRLAWTNAAEQLAHLGYHCHALDGRGHGESDWDTGRGYELDPFVDDAIDLARSMPRKPVWVGASMGGLIGMLAEAANPEGLFEALILVDVTPRWETAGVNRILEFMRAHPDGFASVDDASAAVARYLPHRAQRNDPQRLEKMLVRMDNGRLRWHWDPRLLDSLADNGARYMARLGDAAAKLRLPVLLISGGRSDVVSDHTIAEFQRLVPHATHERIEHATHMVVGDANDLFVHTISNYLQQIAARPS